MRSLRSIVRRNGSDAGHTPGRDRSPGRGLRAFLGVLALVSLACPAGAQSRSDRQELVPRFEPAEIAERLSEGGHTILLRHASTTPIPDKTLALDPKNCATQRVLSEAGQREARRMGAAFQSLGIEVGKVLTSPYCRCIDTGMLAFGEAEKTELLTVADRELPRRKIEIGAEVRTLLDTPPDAGTNTVLIAHTGTLLYSFGLDPKPEGIAHVFKPTGLGLGRPTYLGVVLIGEWPEIAGLASDEDPGATESPPPSGEAGVATP